MRNNMITPYERALMRGVTSHHRNSPRIDVREQDETYFLEAELPGLDEKSIEIKVEDNLLTLSKKEVEEEKKEGKYLLKERSSLPFSRSFIIPSDVNKEEISASFGQGVLVLTMKKLEKALPREIEIKKV